MTSMCLGRSGYSATLRMLRFRRYSKGPTTFEEWKMPVPWGHLSGKWWGDKKTLPIIAIHDYRQNASAFDNLIPKLNVPSVLALDLPGHGLSSHFGKGRYITQLEFLFALRYLTYKLPQRQLSFIGHGMGSLLAFLFSASYFKQVESLISIECTRHVFPVVTSHRPNAFGDVVDRSLQIENSSPVSVTRKELLEIMKSTGRMSNEAAEILIPRSSQSIGDRFLLTNDPRYEFYFFSSYHHADFLTFTFNMRCKMMEIRNSADDELIKYSPGVTTSAAFDLNQQQLIRRLGADAVRQQQEKSWELLRDSCHHFFVHEIQTPGHVLLDESDDIAQLVNDFYAMDLEQHLVVASQKDGREIPL